VVLHEKTPANRGLIEPALSCAPPCPVNLKSASRAAEAMRPCP